MGFFMGNIYSESLLMETQLYVILPQDGRNYIWNKRPKTLILLHGLSDNASTWIRLSSIERYAEQYNLAVIIPEVQRTWYQNMIYGQKPFEYITEELLTRVSNMFQVSTAREDVLIAGWSMGGYGALKCALSVPEKFAYCGALSGAYDIKAMLQLSEGEGAPAVLKGMRKELQAIFGEEIRIPEEADISLLIKKRRDEKENLPSIYMSSGTQDFLYPVFKETRKMCEENLVNYYAEEFQGCHEWKVCDQAIESMLQHFLGAEKRMD